jgi:hypothetical protein
MTPQDTARHLIRAACAVAVLAAAACSRPVPAASRLPSDALDHAIGDVVGDPATCVLVAERATRKVVYRYGDDFNCSRGLPACDRPGDLSAKAALALADSADGRGASCPSNADASRTVGWAEGRVASPGRDLIYSAVMEGQTALPGQEISARLAQAFQHAGL